MSERRIAYVRPTPDTAVVCGEPPLPIGDALIDETIGGLRPRGVTVITATDRQLRLVAAARRANAIARRGRRTR